MKEYQCPICSYVSEFTGKNTCDSYGADIIRKPVTEEDFIVAKLLDY